MTDFLKENNESSVIANKWLNHGWIFRPLLFLININDLSDNWIDNPKLFAVDNSLFSDAPDVNNLELT